MTIGKVYLVGAGPGDPGLFTLRGKEKLENADVVLYDALVDSRILDFARDASEKIFVGKRGGAESISQNEIHAILWEKAVQGKTVVRLKGGDPMIFGRGAEEAEFLASHAIPFEIVPGISSAIAAPSYAGIPLTHREFSSSVAFVTGRRKTEDLPAQLPAFGSVETLVVLMGLAQLETVCMRLVKLGWPRETPAAVVSQGTTPNQKTIVGNVMNIAGRVMESSLEGPALMIVGKVVELREVMQWFEKRPLFGTTILVTRAKKQSIGLRTLLEDEGATVVEFPTIEISPLDNATDVERIRGVVQKLNEFAYVVFTSVNAVEVFCSYVPVWPRDVLCAAIGSETRTALENHHIPVAITPQGEFQQEGLQKAFGNVSLKGRRVLIPGARNAREYLQGWFSTSGAECVTLPVYDTKIPHDISTELMERIVQEPPSIVTFTSSSTIHHFFKILGGDAAKVLMKSTVASIGPVTSQTLQEYGFKPQIVAPQSTIPSLVYAILQYKESAREVQTVS